MIAPFAGRANRIGTATGGDPKAGGPPARSGPADVPLASGGMAASRIGRDLSSPFGGGTLGWSPSVRAGRGTHAEYAVHAGEQRVVAAAGRALGCGAGVRHDR